MLQGVTLKANDNFNGGFRIAVNNGSAYYDYSTEAVTQMLSVYLNPRVTALLKEAEQEANPFAAFTNIQKDIEKANQEYLNNQKDLAESIDNTIKAVEENSEEAQNDEVSEEASAENTENVEKAEEQTEEKPKKKTSLQGLLDSAKKLKK